MRDYGEAGRSAAQPRERRLALAALAVSAFAIGVTEFVIAGVLPQVADSFGVSIPTAGLLVSVYALGVVAGAPTVTMAVLRLPRKQVLAGLLVLFVAGNILTATAPTFPLVLAGRVVAALCHGAFLGIGSIVAADLAAPERRARAIAAMFTGLTVASVAGVPIGTFVGQQAGWRATFVGIAGLGVISMAGVALFVPNIEVPAGGGLRDQVSAFRDVQLWLALAVTALGFGAVYAPFTYVAVTMTRVAGYPPSAVPWLLILFGLGLVVGNPLGARAADRRLLTTIVALLVVLVGVLLAADRAAHAKVPAALTLFLLGVIGFATVPAFTSRVIGAAAADANILASSAAVAAFNLGNATGAYLGGRAIAAGHGYASPNLVGAGMAACAVALALGSAAIGRRRGGRRGREPDRAVSPVPGPGPPRP